jgi:NADH-quinone oxidoreductase subunit G
MVEIEIDGKKVEVPAGSMVMDAANKLGTYIPHFCYHKKLSIAANCRMCLVEVEKAPKPLPACATPVGRHDRALLPTRPCRRRSR